MPPQMAKHVPAENARILGRHALSLQPIFRLSQAVANFSGYKGHVEIWLGDGN